MKVRPGKPSLQNSPQVCTSAEFATAREDRADEAIGASVALILRSPSFENRSTMMLLLTGRDVWEAIVKLGWLSGCPYQKFHLNRN